MRRQRGYGYRNVGFILDRGYFSKGNIKYLDDCGYNFVLMVKGIIKLLDTTTTRTDDEIKAFLRGENPDEEDE